MARKSETDLARYDWSQAERGKYVDKAKRSFEMIAVDRGVVAALGGAPAIAVILRALADALPPQRARGTRAGSKKSGTRAA